MRAKTLNINIIPNLFTLGNLFFGFLSLIFTLDGKIIPAAGLILLAVLLDSMDGKVARKLAVSSDFGKQLDSLCDVVSFGVAPAILVYEVILKANLGYLGLFIAAAFVSCGALRLARFNILNISTYYIGVPITLAGGLIGLLMLFYRQLPWVVYPIALAALAVLMVSPFHVPKLGK